MQKYRLSERFVYLYIYLFYTLFKKLGCTTYMTFGTLKQCHLIWKNTLNIFKNK
jgi:hypothetical protein